MAKKVFNKRNRRKNRVTERRKLKEVSKRAVKEKIKRMLDGQKSELNATK